MGDRDPVLIQKAARAKSMTHIYTVMACLVALILIQFLFLMVGIDGYLGHNRSILLPAALGSGACFAGGCMLIRKLSPKRSSS